MVAIAKSPAASPPLFCSPLDPARGDLSPRSKGRASAASQPARRVIRRTPQKRFPLRWAAGGRARWGTGLASREARPPPVQISHPAHRGANQSRFQRPPANGANRAHRDNRVEAAARRAHERAARPMPAGGRRPRYPRISRPDAGRTPNRLSGPREHQPCRRWRRVRRRPAAPTV